MINNSINKNEHLASEDICYIEYRYILKIKIMEKFEPIHDITNLCHIKLNIS